MVSKLQLHKLLEPVVESLGCTLWGCEYSTHGRHSILRLFIEAEGGIGVEHCEKVSRQVSAVMDVEDPISGEYTLEVSSPGLDRPLYTLEQFKAYIGQRVSIKLQHAFDGRRKFAGQLNGVEGEDVLLVVDNEEFLLPIDSIEKANVVPSF